MQYGFTCIVTGFAAPWASVTVLVPAPAAAAEPAGNAVTNLVVPWEKIYVWSQTYAKSSCFYCGPAQLTTDRGCSCSQDAFGRAQGIAINAS